jgi:hypothetical protein
MEELKKLSDKPMTLMKTFLANLKDDLGNLAKRLEEDAALEGIKEIWGLCALSPRWGERYGFKTKLFEHDLSVVETHEDSIVDKPEVSDFTIDQALHLFIHKKNSFIKVFGK